MSVRARLLAAIGAILVLVLIWVFVEYRPNSARIDELRAQQEQAQRDISDLQAQLQRLIELQRQAPTLRAQLDRFRTALPEDPRIPDFIVQVQDAANLAGIDFLSITPTLPTAFTPAGAGAAPVGGLQAISVTIATEGKFFEIEDFIIRMERLTRAVRINTFALAPGGEAVPPGQSPNLAVSFQLQIFMSSPVGAPAAPPPSPGSPAPGASPTPAGSPVPGSTPVPTPPSTPTVG